MATKPCAVGRVEGLCIDGKPVNFIDFTLRGPVGDAHSGFMRRVSGHDGEYRRTSPLEKGDLVFNWRQWTGISREELQAAEQKLKREIPVGCLLENIIFSGIPCFSQLEPTSRIVFPLHAETQAYLKTPAILAVWEENGPCKTVGARFAERHQDSSLASEFIAALKGKRGVMGLVLSVGRVVVGDEALIYPPAGRTAT